MMNNLFSVFDPCSSLLNFQLSWIILLLPCLLFNSMFWVLNSHYFMLKKLIYKYLISEYKKLSLNSPLIYFLVMFFFIMIMNYIGMFSYIFTGTSHLVVTLSLSLMIWLSINLYNFSINYKNAFIHLIPNGTPMILMPFMVIIELISNLIRPITLSVRLMANMTAGHLIISLISSSCEKLNFSLTITILVFQILLMILELLVCLIQAYVFSTLSLLYFNETNYVKTISSLSFS